MLCHLITTGDVSPIHAITCAGSRRMSRQIPGGAGPAGAGSLLDCRRGFAPAAAGHTEVGAAHNALQVFGPAFAAFHSHFFITVSHNQNFNVFVTFNTFEFINRHNGTPFKTGCVAIVFNINGSTLSIAHDCLRRVPAFGIYP
jgi:hypothetical protein